MISSREVLSNGTFRTIPTMTIISAGRLVVLPSIYDHWSWPEIQWGICMYLGWGIFGVYEKNPEKLSYTILKYLFKANCSTTAI